MKTLSRILLFVCGLSLIAVLFVPMWRIELDAPQYPEGLMMQIYPNKLGGSVDIINGLNHYIGMKTLHPKNYCAQLLGENNAFIMRVCGDFNY